MLFPCVSLYLGSFQYYDFIFLYKGMTVWLPDNIWLRVLVIFCSAHTLYIFFHIHIRKNKMEMVININVL